MIILAVRTLLMKNPWEGNEYSLAQPPYNSNVMFTFRIYQSVLFYLRERPHILSLNFANIEHFRHTCLVFIAETSLISLDKSTMTFLEFALFRWREFRHVSNTDNSDDACIPVFESLKRRQFVCYKRQANVSFLYFSQRLDFPT